MSTIGENKSIPHHVLKVAEPLAEKMGLDHIPNDLLQLIEPNMDFSGGFSPELYERFKQVKLLLKDLANQKMPKHGHIVRFATPYGSYEDSALLLAEGDIRKQNMVVCVAGKTLNLGELKLQPYGLDMHIGCGGPFEPISQSQFQSMTEFDLHMTTYKFWGRSPCANGMIEVTVPMKRWYLEV